MTVKDELLALKAPDGRIMVHEVHDWAKAHPDSEIAKRLNWRDAEAAENWRHFQIRQLIAIHIVQPDGNRGTIALVIDRSDGGGYREVTQVFSHEHMIDAALREGLAQLERVQERYGWLQELAETFDEAKRARARYEARASKAKPQPRKRKAA